jgi:hypothetical protein
MTNPDTAQFMASAGITLNDTPEEVNTKMAEQSERKKVADFTNDLKSKGYEYVPYTTNTAGLVSYEVGGQTLWFKPPAEEEEILSVAEAKSLGVPYGTTRGEAVAMGLTPREEDTENKRKEWAYAEEYVNQYKDDYTPEQLESALKRDTEHLSDSDIKTIISAVESEKAKTISKSQMLTAAQAMKVEDIDTYFRARYTEEELRKIAKDLGFGKWYKGSEAEVKDFLASPSARIKMAELLEEQYESQGFTITD